MSKNLPNTPVEFEGASDLALSEENNELQPKMSRSAKVRTVVISLFFLLLAGVVAWCALIEYVPSWNFGTLSPTDTQVEPNVSVQIPDSTNNRTDVTVDANEARWDTVSVSDVLGLIEEGDSTRNSDGTLKVYDSWRKKCKDIVGWVCIPETNIDYPVVQGEDNEYYSHRNIYGEYEYRGSIFTHYDNIYEYGHTEKNIWLFGHHMANGTMFQNLMKYDVLKSSKNLNYYKSHPVVHFSTIYEPEAQYVIFAMIKCNTREEHGKIFQFIRYIFDDDEDFMDYVDEVRERSIIDTYSCIDVNADDVLLSMQTCSYEYEDFRTVVIARKVRPGEVIDVSSATVAEDPKMPDIFYR